MALSRGQDTREACLNSLFHDTLKHVGRDNGHFIALISFQGETNPVSRIWDPMVVSAGTLQIIQFGFGICRMGFLNTREQCELKRCSSVQLGHSRCNLSPDGTCLRSVFQTSSIKYGKGEFHDTTWSRDCSVFLIFHFLVFLKIFYENIF